MDIFQAIFIAIIEGLTEFLPVSSTGHMIIAQKLLGVESTAFVKAFTIIIQFGAILSVIVLYWKRFFRFNTAIPAQLLAVQEGASYSDRFVLFVQRMLFRYDFYVKLLIAFLPAAVLGYLFSDKIDDLLENVSVVAYMLVLGGIVMLFVDNWFNKPKENQEVTHKKSFLIGCFQCIAMIPGVSRSMITIVGGMSQGLTRKHAAEFSFFLAVPTMAAATGYKVYKLFALPTGIESLKDNIGILIVGNVVAFLVALLAIKFFIGFVTKYGFKFFGWYRIVVGGIILLLLWMGHDLEIMR